MARKYEVFIADRPVIITGTPEIRSLKNNWLAFSPGDVEILDRVLCAFEQDLGLNGLVLFGDPVERLWELFKQRYELVLAAGGVVEDEQGRVLVIHRMGRWDLPKGKLDDGEDPGAGALREVKEECGLVEVSIGGPITTTWHTYERNGRPQLKRTDWFQMRATADQRIEPQLEEDIQIVTWMDDRELDAMLKDTYASIRSVINAWRALSRPTP